jgi:hypothetical protein
MAIAPVISSSFQVRLSWPASPVPLGRIEVWEGTRFVKKLAGSARYTVMGIVPDGATHTYKIVFYDVNGAYVNSFIAVGAERAAPH